MGITNKIWKDLYYLRSYLTCIERTKSNRARCSSCRKLIGKDTLRVVCKYPRNSHKVTYTSYYCSKCGIEQMKAHIKCLRNAVNKVRRTIKTRKKIYEQEKEFRYKNELLSLIENAK